MDISSNDRSSMTPNYSFPDLFPEKASGSRLWDENGKEYIAYLWASDSSSSSMIKCGTFSGTNFNQNISSLVC